MTLPCHYLRTSPCFLFPKQEPTRAELSIRKPSDMIGHIPDSLLWRQALESESVLLERRVPTEAINFGGVHNFWLYLAIPTVGTFWQPSDQQASASSTQQMEARR